MVNALNLPPNYPTWVKQLETRFNQLPVIPRLPLLIASQQVGSIEESRASLLQKAGLVTIHNQGIHLGEHELNAQLANIASWLQKHGMADQWRGELLAVTDASGKEYGIIERAAARPLGITTFAVHLVGRAQNGDFWLQRRAPHKSIDPGKLDTLAGGLVSAGETLQTALLRETWEEAGLKLPDLLATHQQGQTKVRQPVNPEVGGYMVEHGFWYEYQIPPHLKPMNQDGEVTEFVKLSPQELIEQMLQGHVASLACLIFCHLLKGQPI